MPNVANQSLDNRKLLSCAVRYSLTPCIRKYFSLFYISLLFFSFFYNSFLHIYTNPFRAHNDHKKTPTTREEQIKKEWIETFCWFFFSPSTIYFFMFIVSLYFFRLLQKQMTTKAATEKRTVNFISQIIIMQLNEKELNKSIDCNMFS